MSGIEPVFAITGGGSLIHGFVDSERTVVDLRDGRVLGVFSEPDGGVLEVRSRT